MDIGRISLREDERGLLVGGTETGKSTLEVLLAYDFLDRYPDARILVVDSKPRFRPEYTIDGAYAGRLYLRWKGGQYLPGAVVVANWAQAREAFAVGFRVVVVQRGYRGATLKDLLATLRGFYETFKFHRRLTLVDEAMDFYGPTGIPREADDIMNLCSRSGREHGLAMLYCSQRTRAFSNTVMEEIKKLYAFRLDFKKDAERFAEFGAPIVVRRERDSEMEVIVGKFGDTWRPLTSADHAFTYWTKQDYHRVWGPYVVGRETVAQLA